MEVVKLNERPATNITKWAYYIMVGAARLEKNIIRGDKDQYYLCGKTLGSYNICISRKTWEYLAPVQHKVLIEEINRERKGV